MATPQRRQPNEELQKLVWQAKSLMLCGLPHDPTDATEYRRSLGSAGGATLSVTYKTTGGTRLPFGNDRFLLAWMQDRADDAGFISIENVREYFRLFDVSNAGKNYKDFEDRIARLRGLVISIDIVGGSYRGFDDIKLIEAGLTGNEADDRALLKQIHSGHPGLVNQSELFQQLRFGFLLHPKFMRLYRQERAPVPMALMQQLYRKYVRWDYAQYVLYRCHVAGSPSFVRWDEVVRIIDAKDKNNRSRLRRKFEGVHSLIRDLPGYSDFPAEFDTDFNLHVAPFRADHTKNGWKRT
jgi:hypothetical protein